METGGKKISAELLNPEETSLPAVYDEAIAVDYQELSNLACWLDVVTTIITGSDELNTATLTEALLAGARYNGADLEELAAEFPSPGSTKLPGQNIDAEAICMALCTASEALIEQLLLSLAEQRTIKARRI